MRPRLTNKELLERKAAWYAGYQQECEKAAAWAAQEGLPALNGTEKQVAWAQSIRKERLEQALYPLEHNRRLLIRCTEAYLVMRRATNSSWWIENRFREGHSMIEKITLFSESKRAELEAQIDEMHQEFQAKREVNYQCVLENEAAKSSAIKAESAARREELRLEEERRLAAKEARRLDRQEIRAQKKASSAQTT